MKKRLLLCACTAVIACTCWGQTMKKYEGFSFTSMSPNGKWLAESKEGSVVIFNRIDSVYYVYGGEVERYTLGQGNAITNEGIVVGGISDSQPAYWQNGEWHLLPLLEADTVVYNSADAITPDARRICGTMACTKWGLDSNGQMLAPVVWTKGDNGEYQTYQRLPHPAKDFSGRTPMYVTARAISADGKTVYGQIVDYSGMFPSQIVYREDANGEWSYETIGQEMLYKEGTVFPKWPEYEPKSPDIKKFMSEEELAAYGDAMALYEDSVDLYNQGLIEIYPSYPVYQDFLKDAARLEEYTKAAEKYNKEYAAYSDSTYVFYDVYDEALTENSFGFNEIIISENGRYYATSMTYPDPDSDPMAWMPSSFTSPVCFDLQSEGNAMTMVDNKDMISCAVLNDGTLLTATPYMEYTRNAWVIPAGTSKPMLFADWIKAKSMPAYNWLKDNFTFDYESIEYDEDYNEIPVSVPDSLITGTIMANGEGTVFSAYVWDAWDPGENYQWISYVIDLSPSSAIGKVETAEISIYPNPTTDVLNISGDVRSVSIVDLSGRTVYESSAVRSVLPIASITGKGTYLIRLMATDGSLVVKKIVVN